MGDSVILVAALEIDLVKLQSLCVCEGLNVTVRVGFNNWALCRLLDLKMSAIFGGADCILLLV